MGDFRQAQREFDDWLTRHGRSTCQAIMTAFNKKRLEAVDRPGRIRLSPAKRQKLYFRRGGLCGVCGNWIDPKSAWQVDHINPNLTGKEFNAEANLAPTHAQCNREKSSRSIMEQTKKYGRTAAEIIGE